jgi:hypothetical protein
MPLQAPRFTMRRSRRKCLIAPQEATSFSSLGHKKATGDAVVRAVDGVTLPFAWEIRLRIEPSASAQEFQWKMAFTGITHNKL